MFQKKIKNENGFTIIEMLVSVTIAMLIVGIAVTMFTAQRKTLSLQNELTEMRQNSRTALTMIGNDVRMAGYNAGGTLTVSEAGTITFTVDTTIISYNHDASDLEINKKEDTGSYQPIAENIETLNFTYSTDSSGSTDTVTITIVARSTLSDSGYSGDGYRRATVTTTVKLRN